LAACAACHAFAVAADYAFFDAATLPVIWCVEVVIMMFVLML